MSSLAGIVLCGGRSERMGQSKAWLEFRGEPLMVRTVRTLASVASPIIVAGAAGQELPALEQDVLLSPDVVPHAGPLAAFARCLQTVPGIDIPVALVGCDLPLLTAEFVASVAAQLGNAQAAVPFADGSLHPLAAVYRRSVGPIAERLLARGRRSMHALLDELNVVRIELANAPELLNVNSPVELVEALRLAGGTGTVPGP